MMNGYREDDSYCYFHPKQVVIGVCPLCLNDRLLILASKQGGHSSSSSSSTRGSHRFLQKKPHIHLPKIFALGPLPHRRELKQRKSQDFDDHDASTSQEDSFISIKFEENGVSSWEKGKVSKVSLENCSMSWNPTLDKGLKEGNKSVIEHPKPGGSLRWRKRMGHLFQLVRWKRSTNKAEGVKAMKKSWIIRTLTKRT
ncbi:glucose-6-phosphate/phosphate translocator-related family protein [Hibiscus syriacus]|uniref:Glucose-6-phosphate/phosphate translocator-related family protein n=1 Tax=Hibiscus syriacus TaxID=106335 RepID=A0A6A3AG24_HIBSY|nr:uncharacterized protein LOC120130044 [Hibiscus syriacus]KAE8701772.1 glucose-6-phosphate/phosphate translocator-related family protein [Hibiscus syriacus]